MGGLKGETLSPVARPMKFRLTVRDNRAAGGGVTSSGSSGCQSSTTYQINVVGTTPFTVSSPNGGESFQEALHKQLHGIMRVLMWLLTT